MASVGHRRDFVCSGNGPGHYLSVSKSFGACSSIIYSVSIPAVAFDFCAHHPIFPRQTIRLSSGQILGLAHALEDVPPSPTIGRYYVRAESGTVQHQGEHVDRYDGQRRITHITHTACGNCPWAIHGSTYTYGVSQVFACM